MSTTSCKIAPQKAGMTPVKAINSMMITTPIAVKTSMLATFIVCLEIATASLTLDKSLTMITASALSLAAVAPLAPIAIPTSAAVKLGASLTPSPVITTGRKSFGTSLIALIFSAGKRSARISVMPAFLPTFSATCLWSPVSIMMSSAPWRFNFAIVSAVSGRISSIIVM